MRSLSSSLISQLKIEHVDSFGVDGQWEGTKPAPFAPPVGVPGADLASDLQALDAACQPAAKHEIAPIVAVLRARTKNANQGDGEARFSAATLVEDLSKYPRDVAEFACEYWIEGGRDNKWMPSWPELKEICDKRMDGRLRLRRAIVHALAQQTGAGA